MKNKQSRREKQRKNRSKKCLAAETASGSSVTEPEDGGALNQSEFARVDPTSSCAAGGGSGSSALSVQAAAFSPTMWNDSKGNETMSVQAAAFFPTMWDDSKGNETNTEEFGCRNDPALSQLQINPSATQGGEDVTLTDGSEMPSTSSISSQKGSGAVNSIGGTVLEQEEEGKKEEQQEKEKAHSVQCPASCPLPASTRDRLASVPPIFKVSPAYQPCAKQGGSRLRAVSFQEPAPIDNDCGGLLSGSPVLTECGRKIWCRPREVSNLHTWKVFYDCIDEQGMNSQHFVDSMCVLGSFDTMREFASHYGGNLHLIANNATLRVFKSNVQPVWEDPANSGPGAGKWACLLPTKRNSVAMFQALVKAMVQGDLPCANGLVLCRRNKHHMVVVWTRPRTISMNEQKVAIQSILPESLSSTKLTFKSHSAAKHRNTKEEFLCVLQGGRHARTASLEVHFDFDCHDGHESDYYSSSSPIEEFSPELTSRCPSSHLRVPAMDLG